MSVDQFKAEVAKKERFEFGKNWKFFLEKLDDEKISCAKASLLKMVDMKLLEGRTFLDIGSGSGLSSLVAMNCGAKVTAFDYDESSVWCTRELKSRYYSGDVNWEIHQGSILDQKFMSQLGTYDVVYSWGVLHHTGQMWLGIENALQKVKKNGVFFIAIYNDQGLKSHIWWVIKYIYNQLPNLLKKPFAYGLGFLVQFLLLIKYTLKLNPMAILSPLMNYQSDRGMNVFNDMIDWYGGFPYEFATYHTLKDYIEGKGFKLLKGKEASSLGCHELVFQKCK